MNDNNEFRELFSREFLRLQAAGVGKQSAAAQALASARVILQERQRHDQLTATTPSASSVLNHNGIVSQGDAPETTSGHAHEHDSGNDQLTSVTSRVACSDTHPKPVESCEKDKRKGKLPASVYPTSNKRHNASVPTPVKAIPPLDYEELNSLLSECKRSDNYSPVIRLVGSVFSSADALNKSFSIAPTSSASCCNSPTKQISSSEIAVSKYAGKMSHDECEGTAMDVEVDVPNSSTSPAGKKGRGETYTQTSSENKNLDSGPLFDRISIDIDLVGKMFRLLFSCGSEGEQNFFYIISLAIPV